MEWVTILPIEFTVRRDTQALQQYYSLRERCYRQELQLAAFDGSEDEQDRKGLILLILSNGHCVGGARISPQVTLASQLELVTLNHGTCCMWERLVIDPTVRTVYLVREFVVHLINATRDNGFENAMVLSSLRNARFYRRCHTAVGIDFKIHRPVPHCAVGAFAGLEHYLSVAYLERRKALRLAV